MLLLVSEPHWSVSYWLLEVFLSNTTNMPPEREASPNMQLYNLAVEKAGAGKEEAKRSCHGAQWVQSLWLDCWKDCLVSVINGRGTWRQERGRGFCGKTVQLECTTL